MVELIRFQCVDAFDTTRSPKMAFGESDSLDFSKLSFRWNDSAEMIYRLFSPHLMILVIKESSQ